MKTDYRDNSFALKNRPRRQPAGRYVAVIVSLILALFVSGFAGGWFACSYRTKKIAAARTPQTQAAVPPSNIEQAQPPELKNPAQSPPLTFYQTLPKGEKGVIGSGINSNLKDHPIPPAAAKPPRASQQEPQVKPANAAAAAKPASQAVPANPVTTSAQPKPASPAVSEKQPASAHSGDKKFTVQVTSVKNRDEAESMRNRLAAKGYNPMIIGVNVPEKGVVYRVRVGRHMLQKDAQELAARIGSGAMATPE